MKAAMRLFALPSLLLVALLLGPFVASAGGNGGKRSRGIEITVEANGEQAVAYLESHALVIGASEYTNGWRRLSGVKADVEAVTAALEKQGFTVEVLRDPTSEVLDARIKSFIDAYGMEKSNRLLFYFAGHGATLKPKYGDTPTGYIVPVDAPRPSRDEDEFRRRAIDMDRFEGYAKRIQSVHAIFLFDSCTSGSIFGVVRGDEPPADISYKISQPVRFFIAAGRDDESVPDQSIFREQFTAALSGTADVNHDGYVTGTELGQYLEDTVIRLSDHTATPQHPQYGKLARMGLDKGDIVFKLPRAPTVETAVSKSGGPTEVHHASKGRGCLFLNSRPEASILLDGVRQTEFPIPDRYVAVGSHSLVFVAGNGSRLEKTVSVGDTRVLRCTAFFSRNEVLCRQDDEGSSPQNFQ